MDSQVYFAEEIPRGRPRLGEIGDASESGVSDCVCHVCSKSKQRGVRLKASRFSSYDDLYPETTKSLTDHQYFLCAPEVHAYVFKSRAWGKSLPRLAFTSRLFVIKTTLIKAFAGRSPMCRLLFRSYF